MNSKVKWNLSDPNGGSLSAGAAIEIGRDWDDEFEFADENGDPEDLTGYTVESELRESDTPGSALIATFAVGSSDLPNGIVRRSLADDVTSGLLAGQGYHDIKLTAPDGSVETRIYGTASIIGRPTA